MSYTPLSERTDETTQSSSSPVGYVPLADREPVKQETPTLTKTPGYIPLSERATTKPVAPADPYFYKQFPSGATMGKTEELDKSGRPLLGYRNPGDTSTTTDKTRVATTFDPTIPKPLTKDEYYNPRAVGLRDELHTKLGIKPSEQLDHAIALTVGGSNDESNLRAIPTADNQAAGTFEGQLAQQLKEGKISYLDAQIQDAKNKGVKAPWVPPEFQKNNTSPWERFKNYIHNLFTPEEAKAATDSPQTNSYIPLDKRQQVSKPVDDTSLEATKNTIQAEHDRLTKESKNIDLSNEADVNKYNTDAEALTKEIASYNEDIEKYNIQKRDESITTYKKSGGAVIEQRDPNNRALPENALPEPATLPKIDNPLKLPAVSMINAATASIDNFVKKGVDFINSIDPRQQYVNPNTDWLKKGTEAATSAIGVVPEVLLFTSVAGGSEDIPGFIGKVGKLTNLAFGKLGDVGGGAWDTTGKKIIDTLPFDQQTKDNINASGKEISSFGSQLLGMLLLHGTMEDASIRTKELQESAAEKKARGVNLSKEEKLANNLYNAQIKMKGVLSTALKSLKAIPNQQGGFIKNPLAEKPPEENKPEEFKGFEDLSTNTLEKLKGRSTVSKQYISDLTNAPDLKQPERDVIRQVLNDYPNGKDIPVKEFADKVKAQLLPLTRSSTSGSTRTGEGGKEGKSMARYENVSLPKNERGNVTNYTEHIYSSPIKTSAGNVHFRSDVNPNYFAHTRIEDMSDGATRRVIEAQSDLFQKGQLDNESISKETAGTIPDHMNESEARVWQKEQNDQKISARKAEVAKLEPYRNTWHERVIREEIKQAAKDGKTTLQFPTGETAMKIEGLGEQNVWKHLRNDGVYLGDVKPDNIKVGDVISRYHDNAGNEFIVTDVLSDGKFKAAPKFKLEHLNMDLLDKSRGISKDQAKEMLENLKETFDISGKVDTNNPIYKFYEKEVARYLKRIAPDVSKVTDKQGVTWYEIKVSPDMSKRPITAFKYHSYGTGPKAPNVEVERLIKSSLPPGTNINIIFKPELLKESGALGTARTWEDLITGEVKSAIELYTKGGKASVEVGFHEAQHIIENLMPKAMLHQLNKETLTKMTVSDKRYYKDKGYNTPEEQAREYRADEQGKYKAEGAGYKGPIRALLDRVKNFINQIIAAAKKAFKVISGPEGKRGFAKNPFSDKNPLSDEEVAKLTEQKAKLREEIKKASKEDQPTLIKKINEVVYKLNSNADLVRKIKEKEAKRASGELSESGKKYMGSFNKSIKQEVVGVYKNNVFQLGSFGKFHFDEKTREGKGDRFPAIELPKTIKYIKEVYKGSDNPNIHRYYTNAWVSEMPSGEKRIVYTKLNKFGNEEITGWHIVNPKLNPNFIETLKTFGIPAGNRTQISSLEPRPSITLTYGDNTNIPKAKKDVNTPYTQPNYRRTNEGNKELNKIRTKEEAKNKTPTEVEKRITELTTQRDIIRESIRNDKVRKLSKYAGVNGLGEVTGEQGGIWKSMGDEKAMDLGFPSSEAARVAYEKYQTELQNLTHLNDQINSLKREQAATRKVEKDQRSLNRILNKTANQTELEIARKERVQNIREAEIARQIILQEEETKRTTLQEKINKAKLESSKSKGIIGEIKRALFPSEYLDPVSKPILQKWFQKIIDAKQAGLTAFNEAIPKGDQNFQEIVEFQAGKNTSYIRKAFDSMGVDFKKRGLYFDWLDNYMPDVWKDSPKRQTEARTAYMKAKGMSDKEIADYLNGVPLEENKALRLKLRPNFSKERFWPDYVTGMAHGLHPKYDTPADLIGYYKEAGERAIANKELIDELKEQARLLSAEDAPDTWEPVTTRFTREGLYAPPALADLLNGKFRDDNNLKLFQSIPKTISAVSRFLQDLVLSGGLPGTNINFFTATQAYKLGTTFLGDIATLKFRNALTDLKTSFAFIRSNSNAASAAWFKSKEGYIAMMSRHGIDITDRVGGRGYQTLYKKLSGALDSSEGKLGQASDIGKALFHSAFTEKTFLSLMPQIKVSLFEGAYREAIAKGLTTEEAEKFAADTTKIAEGITLETGRSETTKDTLSSLFFAPPYREGLYNIFENATKSFTTEFKNPAYSRSRSLIAGLAIIYTVYNLINKQVNGHYMWDNPPGRELSLKIPFKNGDIAYFDIGPGLLTVPRNIFLAGSSLLRGDFQTAIQKGTSLLSMPAQIVGQVLSNKDYFGNPIYNKTDNGATATKKIAAYVGLEVNHPYISQMYKYISGKQPAYWSLINMAELPVKMTNLTKEQNSKFYDNLAKKAKEQAAAREKIMPFYQKLQDMKNNGQVDEANSLYNAQNTADKAVYDTIKRNEKLKDTKAREVKMQALYDNLQQMKAEGRIDEANAIYFALTPEDQHAYDLVRNRNKN